MTTTMTKRIRMIIDTTPEIRLAVKLAREARGYDSASELVNAILSEALAAELEDAAKYTRKPRKPRKDES